MVRPETVLPLTEPSAIPVHIGVVFANGAKIWTQTRFGTCSNEVSFPFLLSVVSKSLPYRYEEPCPKLDTCNNFASTAFSSETVNITACCFREPSLA